MDMLLPVLLLILCVLLLLLSNKQEGKQATPAITPMFDLYVINLDRAKQRMTDFMKRLQSTDLGHVSPIRFSAVDGRKLRIEDHVTPAALAEVLTAEKVGYRQRHYELTRGAVGCHLSHFGVWERLLRSDKGLAMVCEDDAVVDDDVHEQTLTAIHAMPEEWDMLLLGYWCVTCAQEGGEPGWVRMKRFFGLHCYVIKATAIEKIVAYAGTKIGQQIDSMLSDMCSEGRLTVFGTSKKAAMQTGSSSTVQMPLKGTPDVDPWVSLPAVVSALQSLNKRM